MNKKPLCAAPFLGMFWRGNPSIDNTFDGSYKPCCESNNFQKIQSIKTFKHEDVKDFKKDIFNNNFAKEIRSTLMKGEFHSICHLCKFKEKNGQNSRNNYFRIAKGIEEKYGSFEYDINKGTTHDKIFWLDYRPSNLCNLKCRMCGPSNSSLFAEEIKNLDSNIKEQFKNKVKLTTKDIHIFDKRKSKDQLYNIIPLEHIVYLKLLGGEPLIMEEVFHMLDKLKNNKNTNILITTNATKITDKVIKIFKQLKVKQIHFTNSLDGIGDVYEYIRFPGKWSKTLEGFEKLIDLRLNNLNTKVSMSITMVIQMWNIFNIDQIIDWCISLYRAKKIDRFLFSIVSQKNLSIAILHDDHKLFILEVLEQSSKKWNMSEKEKLMFITPITNMLKVYINEDEINEFRIQFRDTTLLFDKIRNQDITLLDKKYLEYI